MDDEWPVQQLNSYLQHAVKLVVSYSLVIIIVCFFFNRYFDQQQELQRDVQKHMTHLQLLKDYDERLAKEKEETARREQESKRKEVTRSLLYKNEELL